VTDRDLEKLAQRLGARAAERLDVERLAQAVVTRLREEPRVTAGSWLWKGPAWLRIAAAIVLLLGAALAVRGLLHEPSTTSAVAVPLDGDLSDLTADQLRETMSSLDQPLIDDTAGEGSIDGALEALNKNELRTLLRTLEG
jgi:hypothetical protein